METTIAIVKHNGVSSEVTHPGAALLRAGTAPQTMEETLDELRSMAARRTGRIPAELMAGHVLTITEGGDWPVRCAAMEAILRRCKFGDRDGLVVTSAPAGSIFGSYVTGRTATSGQAAPRRQTSAKKRARNAEPRPYRTVLTRLDPLEGNCDCPDYLRGSLGLCKHLICVLDVVHTARSPQLRAAPPTSPGRHATLSWDPVRPLRGAGERLLGLRWTDSVGGGRPAARFFRLGPCS